MAVGCSHGAWADPAATAAVLRFADAWNPHTRIHLGDFLDTTTWRAGCKGTSDERASNQDDLNAGLGFIKKYRPDLLFNGNHEIRVWEHLKHHDAKLAFAAKWTIREIKLAVHKKCRYIETYDMESVVRLGDTNFLHGVMYSSNAIQEHAEHFGKSVFAHLHRVGIAHGRNYLRPAGHCVGYLGDTNKFRYAARQRSVSQWSNGFGWGEYSAKECVIWLAERNKIGPWRLPL